MSTTPTATIRVVSGYFVAGIVLDSEGLCVEATPILKWAVGKPIEDLVTYFNKKSWHAKKVC